jgi:hypothetical protein
VQWLYESDEPTGRDDPSIDDRNADRLTQQRDQQFAFADFLRAALVAHPELYDPLFPGRVGRAEHPFAREWPPPHSPRFPSLSIGAARLVAAYQGVCFIASHGGVREKPT